MKKFKEVSVIIIAFTLWLLLLSFRVTFADADGENNANEEISGKKRLQDSYAFITTSTKKYVQIAGYVMSQLQNKFFPPNLDFRATDEPRPKVDNGDEGKHGGAGEKVKEAVGKSFQTSKEAVEESAKSAAEIVGEAVHKTTEKLKKTSSPNPHGSHVEL